MVYCGNCGHPNPDSGSFCTACGSPLVKPEDVTPAPVEEEPVMEEEPVVESEPVDVAPVESEPVAPETDSQSMATPGRISIPLRRKSTPPPPVGSAPVESEPTPTPVESAPAPPPPPAQPVVESTPVESAPTPPPAAQPAAPAPKKGGGGKKSCLIIAIILFVVMLVVGGAITYFVVNWAKKAGLIEADAQMEKVDVDDEDEEDEDDYGTYVADKEFEEMIPAASEEVDDEVEPEPVDMVREEKPSVVREEKPVTAAKESTPSNGGKKDDDKIYEVAEKQPAFPSGISGLSKFLNENVSPSVLEKGLHGRVFASFVVEKDGSLSDFKIVKSLDPDLDKETLRLLKSMPYWSPGTINGEPVRVKYTVPVTY